MSKAGVVIACLLLVAGGAVVGYPYYKDYLPFGEEHSYVVTVEAGPGGTVIGGGTYVQGSKVQISAVSETGYGFDKWSDGDKHPVRTITVKEDIAYTASFLKICKISCVSDTEGAGNVTGSGDYTEGSTISISATANYGYGFLGWSDNVKTAKRTVTVTSDKTYTAMFETYPTCMITVESSHPAGGAVTGDGKVIIGEKRTLSVIPNYGYVLVGWFLGGVKCTDNQAMTVTAVADATYSLVFEKRSATVSVTAEDPRSCTVTGAKEYYPDEVPAIAVTMKDGFSFVGMFIGDNLVSDMPRYSFTVTKEDVAVGVHITVKSNALRDPSFTAIPSSESVPATVTVTGKANPDARDRSWTVKDDISGKVLKNHVGDSFTMECAAGVALRIEQSIRYPDGTDVSASKILVVDETVVKKVDWRYQEDKTWKSLFGTINNASDSIEFTVKFSRYYELFKQNPGGTSYDKCGSYVTSEDPLVAYLAELFGNRMSGQSDTVKANYVLKFAQHSDYQYDRESVYAKEEYWKYPYQTLFDMTGDCEDKSFLYASIMKKMGYDCVIFTVDTNGDNKLDHVAVGVNIAGLSGYSHDFNGKQYFYCETSYSAKVTGFANDGNAGQKNDSFRIVGVYKV